MVGQGGFDAAHPFLLVDQALRAGDRVVVLGDVRAVLEHGDVGLQRFPVATPAQLIAVDLDCLGVEVVNVIAAAHIAQKALDVRQ
ncbi:hypothetical protein D3C76_1082210 [compost metagenome]